MCYDGGLKVEPSSGMLLKQTNILYQLTNKQANVSSLGRTGSLCKMVFLLVTILRLKVVFWNSTKKTRYTYLPV